ncbi:helix-turn-helix transcriptional regulator [Rhodococcus sp. BP-252]|uniref:TetR/AcrR family transcriptional regulator n=1 Tax=unclassified Rhodococcus (in: high G+C Gram-positive bacteria) TaxID=192944 RepID=UPI001C9B99A9|nr:MULTISPECIES: helix-turn-helix domain-containing protein [unclassified Rhodococcus (in: high G+C Gram-positive bacteria)]MBY6414517.1 helix-turn-helix transcriptional regulator [Rhodococcus sp. BP-320]MBY6419574.1 helix-turn-helix transcriptional regulator [Rhodococcus sp. BP-321]MBY6424184.1 helix-turn-helix transcriptional regulator [Rhodococcus sp. BP-324]MBY6429519.1 helix-turn-helix transcriptional regulator [Rhodococcus sp. BP-323]MBY6434416.1 helix-turn-helix transcriptional regulato
MSSSGKPLRADAARNRARVVEVAYEAFAADGLKVSLDEIARRAGVGAGTVHRHFPAKDDLFRAVVSERMAGLIADGYALLGGSTPGEAVYDFVRALVLRWGASDRGLVDALAGVGIDVTVVVPDAEADFLALLDGLLAAARAANTIRSDIDTAQLKVLVVGCQAMHGYDRELGAVATEVVLDGLRPVDMGRRVSNSRSARKES